MKKRLAVASVGALALLGLGGGLVTASAKPAAPIAPTSVTATAPACAELYIGLRLGYCWHGLY